MTETPRETRVLGAVVTLVDSLLDDFDVLELLTDLTARCSQLLDVEAAGLLLADPRGRLHLLAATSEESRELELFQLQADEGPCLECYSSGQPISVADLSAEAERWPQFVPAAADSGFVSVHAVPMRAAGTVLGALGLFGTTTGDLGDADTLVAQTLAHIACVAILQDAPHTSTTVLPQLRTALSSRIVVEQAKGYLREHFDVTVEAAFGLLRQYARTQGEHLTEVCRLLIKDPAARRRILAAIGSSLPPRIPENLELPPAETLAYAQDLLNQGLAHKAHEVLEAAWKNGPGKEKSLWQGLAQLAAGITHLQGGNLDGAVTLLHRGSAHLRTAGGPMPHHVDIAGLTDWAAALIDDLNAPVEISPERLRPALTTLSRTKSG